jgi:hypothetical protein
MIPECPKGPEHKARPEGSGSAPSGYTCVFTHAPGVVLCDFCKPVESEGERRLSVEVSQLRADMRIRQGALNDVLGRDRSLDTPSDYYAAVEEVSELKREVSRLREQLAAQTQVPVDAEAQLLGVFLDLQGGVNLATANAILGKVKTWFPSASESLPVTPQRHPLDLALSALVNVPEKVAEFADDDDEPLRVSASSEASPIVHTVLLSSDTGVMGEWQAFCSGCRQRSVGDLAHAEFWKDQHLADVLTPQLQANSKLEQNLVLDELSRQSQEFEGRPSGSGAAAPRPVIQDEFIVRTADNADLPQRIKKVGAHRPVWVDVDCPSCGDAGGCGHADLLCCAECDDNWPCNVVANVAEELERMAFCVEDEPVRVLIGRARELRGNAAQAARSEATLEVPEVDPDAFGAAGYLLRPPAPEVSCTEQEAEK